MFNYTIRLLPSYLIFVNPTQAQATIGPKWNLEKIGGV